MILTLAFLWRKFAMGKIKQTFKAQIGLATMKLYIILIDSVMTARKNVLRK